MYFSYLCKEFQVLFHERLVRLDGESGVEHFILALADVVGHVARQQVRKADSARPISYQLQGFNGKCEI